MLQLRPGAAEERKKLKKKKNLQMQHLAEYLASLFHKGRLGGIINKKQSVYVCIHVDGVFLEEKVYLS